jgi:hypothetical protein
MAATNSDDELDSTILYKNVNSGSSDDDISQIFDQPSRHTKAKKRSAKKKKQRAHKSRKDPSPPIYFDHSQNTSMVIQEPKIHHSPFVKKQEVSYTCLVLIMQIQLHQYETVQLTKGVNFYFKFSDASNSNIVYFYFDNRQISNFDDPLSSVTEKQTLNLSSIVNVAACYKEVMSCGFLYTQGTRSDISWIEKFKTIITTCAVYEVLKTISSEQYIVADSLEYAKKILIPYLIPNKHFLFDTKQRLEQETNYQEFFLHLDSLIISEKK